MGKLFSIRGVLAAAACVVCLGVALPAQDSETPPPLGDIARQTRAQRASAAADKSNKTQDLADQMQADQLAGDNVPTGFKNYNAGDYRLFVPFPFSLEGRENGGTVLLGSRLGITNTEVVAGNPIPVPADLSDSELLNVAQQFAGQFGSQPYCSPIMQGQRKAFRCAWQGNPSLLGHMVWGSMEFIVGSNSLIPVMCVSPDDTHSCAASGASGHGNCSERDQQPDGEDRQKSHAAADVSTRDERTTLERTTFQICDQVIYPSIQLKEDIVVHPATISEKSNSGGLAGQPAAAAEIPVAPQNTSGETGLSLAELARQTRQAPHSEAHAKPDSVERTAVAPAGFQVFVLQYCQNPQQCSEAPVVIPEKSEIVSRTNGQYIFKAALDGESAVLYAGPADVNAPYRSLTDADYTRMRDLANPNAGLREKPDSVNSQELTIEGNPAVVTRFRYQRDQKRWWIGERVLIANQGSQFLLGCTAPEEHFADAEAMCTTLMNSLRLP